eukprot:2653351-Rhodomonas_salina.2
MAALPTDAAGEHAERAANLLGSVAVGVRHSREPIRDGCGTSGPKNANLRPKYANLRQARTPSHTHIARKRLSPGQEREISTECVYYRGELRPLTVGASPLPGASPPFLGAGAPGSKDGRSGR